MWPVGADGAASTTGAAAGAAGAAGAATGAGAYTGAAGATPPRWMRTDSSPSVISNSAIPDSSTNSISFFIFLMSIILSVLLLMVKLLSSTFNS